jgi:hypothetical protein
MRLKHLFETLEEDFPEFEWHHINIKNDRSGVVVKYGVTTIPALFIDTPNGIKSYSGSDQTAYYKILNNSK